MINRNDVLVSYKKLATCLDEAMFDRNHCTYRWTNSVYYMYVYMYKTYSSGATTFLITLRNRGN